MSTQPTALRPASRTVSFASLAAAFDDDAIKASVATAASPAVYFGVALDGVVGAGPLDPPRSVTIARSSSPGSYTTAPIVVTGTYQGRTVTDSLTPTNANGNDTLYGSQPFDAITSIAVPAQVDTSGSFKFGVGDLWAGPGRWLRGVKAVGGDGFIALRFDEGVPDDTLPCRNGEVEHVAPRAIKASGTTVAFTAYLG